MPFLAANNACLCGRYTLLGKLGAGGQGEVWRARDHEQGLEIALKILNPELARTAGAWDALQREYAIASRLDHPLILKVYRPEREGGVVALPMELAPGGDLRRLRSVSYLEIGPVLLEVAQALAYTHERGIVHRDLKPGNVLFDSRGHVRLADFGVAGTVLSPVPAPPAPARAGLSPFTASPEQLRGGPPTVADDIYGLGALAYELLSGYPPHYPRFQLERVMKEPVPPLKPAHQAPARLIALVMAMLCKRAEERPASMQEVIDSIGAALNDTLAFDEPAEPAGPEAAAPEPQLEVIEAAPICEPSAPMKAQRAERPRGEDLRELWADIKVERMPDPARLTPQRRARWPWVLIVGLAAAAAVSFFWLPSWAAVARSWAPSSFASLQRLVPQDIVDAVRSVVDAPPHAVKPAARRAAGSLASDAATEDDVRAARAHFEARLAALDARGAGVWGGHEYADAKAREAQAVGADEAGSPSMAVQRLAEAGRLLGEVEQSAPNVLAAQLSSGEQALRAGNGAAARQAFELARRIDPSDSRATDGLKRAQVLDRVLPLMADGLNAEAGHDYSRAVQDYRGMLALDPGDAKARAALRRASAALEADEYAQAVGIGLESLGDGRLEAAREAFEHAHSLNRHGREATEGLERVSTALRARELTELKSRATALEAQHRSREALQAYDAALQLDPSLSFAQQGKARLAATGDLTSRLQALVDDPQRLESLVVREEAADLIEQADAVQPSVVALRSLAARLAILVPQYDKTVQLALVSDNVTEVEIPQIGAFGTFSRREIDLKPGKYTVIGTRAGYRDVRRDVTIAPGQQIQTISVRCEEPI